MPHRLSIRSAIIISCFVTAAAAIWFLQTFDEHGRAVLMVFPGVAFTLMLIIGSDHFIERSQHWFDRTSRRIFLVPAALWILYIAWAVGMNIAAPFGAALMAAYLTVPFLLFSFFRKLPQRFWIEPVVILWLWLPLEFGIVRRVLVTGHSGDLHYAFAQLLAIDAGLFAFVIWNQTPGVGYRFESNGSVVRDGVLNFLIFSAIAIPLGIGIGFIHFNFRFSKLLPAPAVFAGIFLFTALPEEFLFRGLIQNWLERTTKNPSVSLAIASVIFGASHLNNGSTVPNYRYFLMATIAGVFYGRAWRKNRSLMSSSMTHGLVDTCWSVFFR